MKKSGYGVWGVVILLVVLGAQYLAQRYELANGVNTAHDAADDGSQVVRQAFEERRSKLWMEVQGRVTKMLPDDNEGSRHQRFLLAVGDNRTVLVAHNIDLAERIAMLRVDDVARIRGRYEWNDKGGVLHWTHHDPRGNMQGGWILHDGKTYR
ncbi:MAG: DUF3465 domain-containing protein [Thiotrichales bacterium]